MTGEEFTQRIQKSVDVYNQFLKERKMELITEVDISDFDNYNDFANAFLNQKDSCLGSEEGFDMPCYFDALHGIQTIRRDEIPWALEAACQQNENGILFVSVTSKEPHYKEWLAIAEDYPGATITKLPRPEHKPNRIVYALMFPSIPIFEEDV